MPTDCISYQNSGYFSSLMNDYLDQKNELHSLYNRFPTLENFEGQIEEKKINFNGNDNSNGDSKRQTLVSVLKKQYSNLETSVATKEKIESLALRKYLYHYHGTPT